MFAKLVAVVGLAIIAGANARVVTMSSTGIRTSQGVTDINKWWMAGTRVAYDCSGHDDGNYPHPTKCTHYIACVAQSFAYEMVCAMNHDGNPLYYVQDSGPNPSQSYCDYPALSGCGGGPGSPPPTEGTTVEDTTTTAATITTEAPGNGESCDPENCQEKGNCTHYFVCNKNSSTWERRECGVDLFWNSAIPNGHGGACDYFQNLPAKLQESYKADHSCIPPCEWWQAKDQTCSENYMYRREFDNATLQGREEVMTCPSGLLWLGSPSLTCGHCSDARNTYGAACC